ncbi:SpoIID/LytB domain-containing protein [Nocardioides sp. C4-1]|uniref:SpoIID/LytB domain-containing protein n=1 Tax=Nocardioides sp. C4-1 TaxID=3151851 RepID=UPI0032646D01
MTTRSARSTRFIAHVAALVTVVAFVSATPAEARVDRGERRAGAVQVVGNGYGHGHGMSQWGAQRQAERGRSYRQILGFYYQGLTYGSTTGRMRVWISGDTTDDVVVVARPALKVRALGNGKTFRLKKPAARLWRIKSAAGGSRSAIAWKGASGGWRTVRTVAGPAEFFGGGLATTLVTPTGRHAFRGKLRSARPSPTSARRDTVNVVTLDDYIQGVVPREVYTSWRPAALRAQAVAARTYAAHERATPLARHYDICDTTACQVYGGVAGEAASTNAAIRATARQVLLHRGEPAFTQYSASNGGWTAQGSQPYLVAQPDPYDDTYRGVTDSIAPGELQRAFPAIGTFERVQVLERDGNGQWGGRVLSIRVVGSQGSATVSGESFRSSFGLNTTWFQVR